jgi:ribonuclease III
MDEERRGLLRPVSRRLLHRFKDLSLLDRALTHRSFVNEHPRSAAQDNERLEFLGDAVLNLCVSDLLMELFPSDTEGSLSKRRASCVNERTLATLATALGLGQGLLLGKGEVLSGGREKTSLLADALEAVTAAVYLDGGFKAAERFVRRCFENLTRQTGGVLLDVDHKTRLQEVCMARFQEAPRYSVVLTTGPEHDKTFQVLLEIPDGLTALGIGKNRKEAEQDAAGQALERLDGPLRRG